MRRIVFTATAASLVAQICDWYSHERPGLAAAFLDEANAGLARVVQYPHAFPALLPPLRRALMHTFPYSIWYVPTASAIVVRAIRHQARHPGP